MTEDERAKVRKTINAAVGRYTLVIVFIISAGLLCMGFGWAWWIAGLGPIILIPLCAWSFALALDMKFDQMLK